MIKDAKDANIEIFEDIEKIRRLLLAVRILAINCKNVEGIEAFIEVIVVIADLIELIKEKNDKVWELAQVIKSFKYTSLLLSSIDENLICTKAAELTLEKSPIGGKWDQASEKLQLLTTLIINQNFIFIKCVDLSSTDTFTVEISDKARGKSEIDEIRLILDGFKIVVVDYIAPIELSLTSKHKTQELSVALSPKRFLSCFQRV
jgi:hypothetical protein